MTVVNYLHNLNNDIECQLCCTQFDHKNYDECKDCHYKICNECYDNYVNKYKYKTCPQCRIAIQPENSDSIDDNSSLYVTNLSIFDRYRFFFTILTILLCWMLGALISGRVDPEYILINFISGLMIFTIFILIMILCCSN